MSPTILTEFPIRHKAEPLWPQGNRVKRIEDHTPALRPWFYPRETKPDPVKQICSKSFVFQPPASASSCSEKAHDENTAPNAATVFLLLASCCKALGPAI